MHETCSKCAHHQSPPLSPNPIVNKESTQTFQNVFDATSINFLTLDMEAFHLEVKMFLPSPAPENFLEQLFLLGQVHKRWAIIHNGVVLAEENKKYDPSQKQKQCQWPLLCTPTPTHHQMAAGHAADNIAILTQSCKQYISFSNQGEGPYQGLLLVESVFYHFHI